MNLRQSHRKRFKNDIRIQTKQQSILQPLVHADIRWLNTASAEAGLSTIAASPEASMYMAEVPKRLCDHETSSAILG